MRETPTVQPVPRGKIREALEFLVAGRRRDGFVEAKAASYRHLIENRGPGSVRLWWALQGRQCLAVSLVLVSPGKTGLVFFCPPGEPGVDRLAQIDVIRHVTRGAIGDGLAMVQALAHPRRRREIEILESAGYERLAELVYLCLDLTQPARQGLSTQWEWVPYGAFDEKDLLTVIAATYESSLDCPALNGVREVADIVDGHKTTGRFSPALWWLIRSDGADAGCVLLNESDTPGVAEVVYLGVAPAFRGRGLARQMVRHAGAHARRQGFETIRLAVDAANTPARAAYRREGFQETARRVAYIFTWRMRRDNGPATGAG